MKTVMKMIRAATVLLCSAGLVASAAVAQQDAPPPPAAGQQQGPPMGMHGGMDQQHHMDMMQQQLGLNADQMDKIKAIMADSQAKMDALRANTSLAPEDRRAQSRPGGDSDENRDVPEQDVLRFLPGFIMSVEQLQIAEEPEDDERHGGHECVRVARRHGVERVGRDRRAGDGGE